MSRTTEAGDIKATTKFSKFSRFLRFLIFRSSPWCRRAAVVLVLLLVVSSCHRGLSESDLQRTFDAANLAFLRGELTEAQALSEQGIEKAGPKADSVWSWRFRLL